MSLAHEIRDASALQLGQDGGFVDSFDHGFDAGWAAAIEHLESQQHKIQTTEAGVGWIARDTIGGAIALLELGTLPHSLETE